MGLRVLVIDDEDVYRRLLTQHVVTGCEAATVTEYDPSTRGRLPGNFHAAAYDVILLDDRPGDGPGLDWLQDLRNRPDCPPVVYLLSEPTAEAEAAAIGAGAYACLSKQKIKHRQLVATLGAIQEGDRRAEPTVGTDEADRLSRFGDHVIRGYRYLRKIAEGPASAVYLAVSLRTGLQVALKVLTQSADNPEGKTDAFGRFLREYQIASGIRHPNVARIFDVGVCDDYAFIAMEYFPAGDLRARIRKGIAPQVAASLLRQMAEALRLLHQAGVLHRDLKPGNVMLRENGSVVLIDFGMSKQVQLEADITGRGEIFGTPYYMSPEQGHGRPTDARSDIYSLGIIFYEMLTQRKPYVAATPMLVIYKHANDPLPELPAALKRFEPILYNCIAKDPQRRYASAEMLIAALEATGPDETEDNAVAY